MRWLSHGVLAIVAVCCLARAAVAQEESAAPFGGVGGVKISRAEATAACRLARHVMKTVTGDASLKRLPTHVAVVHAVVERLEKKWPLDGDQPARFAEKRPMQVFLTLYQANGTELSSEGRGQSLAEAVVDAAASLAESERYRTEGFADLPQVRVAFDLTVYLVPYMVNLAEPFLYSMRPGIDGMVYENGNQQSIILPWEAVRRDWVLTFKKAPEPEEKTGESEKKSEGDTKAPPDKKTALQTIDETRPARTPEDLKTALFRTLVERAGTTMGTWRAPMASVLRFEVQSFVEPAAGGAGGDAIALYRVGPVVRSESLTDEEVGIAAGLAADFLARTPNDDKEVREGYDPLRNEWSGEFSPSRQALVAAALADMYRTTEQAWMLRAARTLAVPVVQSLRRETLKDAAGTERRCAFIGEPMKAELARTAQSLAGLAAVQATGHDEDRLVAIGDMVNALLMSQRADGSFPTYFAAGTRSDLVAKDAEDLRGESLCLLALARAWEQTGRQEVLEASRKTAEYFVFEREKKLGRAEPQGLADPYLVEALAVLDQHLVNDAFVAYAAKCAAALSAKQATDASQVPADELGGFRSGAPWPDAEYTSFCLRGLRALDRMAARIEAESPDRYRKLGLAAARDATRQSARRGEAFLLGLQYTPSVLFYAPTARLAAGGFRHSVYDPRISIISVANFLLAEAK